MGFCPSESDGIGSTDSTSQPSSWLFYDRCAARDERAAGMMWSGDDGEPYQPVSKTNNTSDGKGLGRFARKLLCGR